jgi:RimJ/RimL family protein N-acetyltransferase
VDCYRIPLQAWYWIADVIIDQPKELIASFVNEKQGLPSHMEWASPFTTLGLVTGGKLVAGVVYNYRSLANVQMHVGAEGSHWLTPEFLFAVFDYPFNRLCKRRVTAITKKKNKKAREFVEHLGFNLEGSLPHYFPDADGVIYGMLKENCRFLEMRVAA